MALAAGLILPAATGFAQNYWQGPANGSADYNTPADWVGLAVPTGSSGNPTDDNGSNSVVLIQAGDPAWAVNSLRVAWENNVSGAYLQSGGSVTTTLKVRIGIGNSGVEGGPTMNTGSVGYYTLNGGAITSGSDFNIGEFGQGTLNVNGGTITCNGNFADNNYQWAASNGGGTIGTVNSVVDVLNQTAGIITVSGNNQMFVGNGGPAIYNLSGGTNNVGSYLAFGRSGGYGTLNMTGGLLVENGNGGGNLLVGSGYQDPSGVIPVGVLNQSGGTISCAGGYFVPESHPALGTNYLSGNAVLKATSWLCVGRGGYGEMDISGNAAITRSGSGSHFDVAAGGDNNAGQGVINQTGGTITDTTSDFWLGEVNTATWNMSGGTNTLLNVVMSVNNGINSTLNLSGGLLRVNSIHCSSSLSITTLNLNGGTIQANGTSTTFITGIYQTLLGGNVTIDSQGYTVTIPEALQDNGGGSLTKVGTGTLYLTGANSYAGTTTVSAGTLETTTASSGGGPVVVADGANFETQVTSGGSQFSAASLTAGTTTGSSLSFDLGSSANPSSAPLNVAGAFIANGTITINVAGSGLSVASFPLIQFASLSGTQTFVLGALPPGVAANLSVTGTQVVLNVTSSGEPRWNGNVTGGWDLGTNQDWFDLITLVPTVYSDGKPVVFDDNATGTTTVTLTGTVKPAAINFNNDVLPYTIVGSGLISGTTGLNINGTTNVTIANTGGNSFTGPVTINSGTLSVASLANGGSPSAIGASSSNPTNLVIVDGVLNYTGASVTANRGFTVGGTNATINTANNLTLGGNVAAAGNVVDGGSGFIKMGPGQLDLTAVGDNEFANNYNPGVQIQNGTFMLDGSLGSQTNHTVGDFYVGNTTTSGAAMILTNTILNVDGWLALGRINGGINNTSTLTAYNSTVNCGHLSLGWDGNLPNNLSSQFITLNGTSTLTDGNEVNLAEGANASFTLNINNNSLFHVTQPVYIAKANNATGTVVVANSGQLVQVNGWFDIAAGANSIGSLTAKNTSSLSLDGDCNLADTGSGAIATLTAQDNATVHANNLYVGKSSSSIGTVNITNSATINMGSAIRFADGANSTGTVNVEGGSLVCTQYINMAGGSSSTATLNIMGGSVTGGNDCTVGDQATAVVNLVANGGGVLTVPNTLYLSRGSAAANGTVNLNVGSTVICGNINNGWAFNEGNTSPTFNPNAFNFNGGTLEPVGAYSYVFPNVNMVVQSGGAVININSSTAEIEMGAALVNGGGAGGLTKLGAGILRLDGVNTFTGTTLVSSGTFEVAGNGVIAGPVSVASGATLAGDIGSVETFYINNTLTLAAGSTTTMTVTPASNDEIFGLTTVNYGGALVVTNSSTSPLVAGHTYMLFNSANPGTGNFSSVTILPSGQFTGTFNPANGSLTIVAAAAPTFNSSTLSGGNLVLTGTGGTPSGTYSLLTATNLTTPIASWTTNTTGTFDTGGAFSNAIPVNATTPAQFFRMKTP